MLYLDYIYHIDNKHKFIIDSTDFEDNLDKYSNSQIFEVYKNLSSEDKLFINDFINYTVVKHKKYKPNFKKRVSSIKDNIIFAALTSNLYFSINVFIIAILPFFAAKYRAFVLFWLTLCTFAPQLSSS